MGDHLLAWGQRGQETDTEHLLKEKKRDGLVTATMTVGCEREQAEEKFMVWKVWESTPSILKRPLPVLAFSSITTGVTSGHQEQMQITLYQKVKF